MRTKIWIALLALAFAAFPGEPRAHSIAPGWMAPPHGAVTNPGSNEIKPGQRLGQPAAISPETKRRVLAAYGQVPLAFVPNAGQANAGIRLYAQGSGFRFAFLREEALFAFTKTVEGKTRGAAVALRFIGARPQAEPQGRRPGTGRVNYLLGNDSTQWHSNLPTYEEIVYRDLWPGIDLVFRGADGQLKYEFVLRPGAEVAEIRLAYGGAEGLSLDQEGNLLVETPIGPLTDARPVAYQELGTERVPVASRYRLGPGQRYGFAIGTYDRGRSLVIDPGLLYSTYLGGSGGDEGFNIVADASGAAYVTGNTGSTDFPITPGAFDVTFNGGGDAFVTKLNPAGSTLAYSTFLGGDSFDGALGIVVDAAGSAYVTGNTRSTDFPTSPAAFDPTFNGVIDAFVARLDATGGVLLYSTYLGGDSVDVGREIAIDSAGNAYVTGETSSSNFPVTPGAYDATFNGGDAFVTKVNTTGSAPLLYSTFLGGTGGDVGEGLAVDAAGNAYVTGFTGSGDFPTTPGAFDTTYNGGADVFVTALNTAGSAPLLYSTYLGGTARDLGLDITLDAAGEAYVTGETQSSNFPTTPAAFDMTFNGARDAFVTKLNTAGSAPLVYSSFLGGSGVDIGYGIALDVAGDAFLAGSTESTDFPTTPGAFDTSGPGGHKAFVTKVEPAGSALLYSTYLGGGRDVGLAIAVDVSGFAYVTGFTFEGFPTTPLAYDTTPNGITDAFVAKIGEIVAPPATLTLDPPAATNPVETEHCVTATVEDATGNPVPDVTVRFTVTGSVNTSGSATTDANGQTTFCYQGPPLPGMDVITAFADTDNDGTQDVGEPMGTATKTWVLPVTTPLCEITITNGGRITALNGDRATFGGNAQSDADGNTQGQEEYQDHGPAQPLNVHSINVLAIVCDGLGQEASIYGQATIGGVGSFFYRIKVKDVAEPGVGQDTYWILLQNGYNSGEQVLEGGNVQIRRQ